MGNNNCLVRCIFINACPNGSFGRSLEFPPAASPRGGSFFGFACCSYGGRDCGFVLHYSREGMRFPGGGAAAEALQSCPTLCDPTDGSPPGSPSLGFSSKNTGVGATAFSSQVALGAKKPPTV